MNLPFTVDQFLSIFEQYNQSVWPMQILLNLLGLAAIVLAVRRYDYSDKVISAILAFLWVWIGLVYHIAFFASINPAAYVFGLLNIVQGGLFLFYGVARPKLTFGYRGNLYGVVGLLLVIYALLIYPTLGYTFGHAYPKAPTFGIPCPTSIFTFGLLLWTQPGLPKPVLIIPFLWSLLGFTAALKLGILEDIGLLVAGVVGAALIIVRDRRASATEIAHVA